MNGPAAGRGIEATTKHFAIKRDHLSACRPVHLLCPRLEALAESIGIKTGKDVPEDVVAGNAARQFQSQSALEPRFFGRAVAGYRDKILGSAEHRTQGDAQNIDQAMALRSGDTWIRQVGKVSQ